MCEMMSPTGYIDVVIERVILEIIALREDCGEGVELKVASVLSRCVQ